MEVTGYGYKQTDIIKISEQIYEQKQRKKELELELDAEQFHYKYIPRRKNLVEHEVFIRLFFIIPLTLMLFGCIAFMMMNFSNTDAASGILFLISMLIVVFGGYADVKLLKREFQMLVLLSISRNGEKALKFARKYNINTFQSDEYKSREKVKWIKDEIDHIEEKINRLEQQRQMLLEEQQRREDILRKKEVLFDENPKITANAGKLTLKETDQSTEDAGELYEFYIREEQEINNRLIQLEGRLQHTAKEIVKIEEDFQEVKIKMIISLLVFVLVVFIQSAFTGELRNATSLFCLVGGLFYLFYMDSRCKQPILLYFIEHDSDLTREYAFVNGILPVKVKRNEIIGEIEHYKKELTELKNKRENIIF